MTRAGGTRLIIGDARMPILAQWDRNSREMISAQFSVMSGAQGEGSRILLSSEDQVDSTRRLRPGREGS